MKYIGNYLWAAEEVALVSQWKASYNLLILDWSNIKHVNTVTSR